MRIFSKSNLTLIAISVILSGCIVQSRQLNSLLELIKEPPMDLSTNSWLVRYSDYESIVFAISTQEGILFSNNLGDQVLFDGWTLRIVKGMGRRQINVSISDKKNIRIFKRGNTAISNHRCDQWKQQKNQGMIRYTQYCGDKQGYSNSILVNDDGDILLIRQIVDERYTALTLTKLEYR